MITKLSLTLLFAMLVTCTSNDEIISNNFNDTDTTIIVGSDSEFEGRTFVKYVPSTYNENRSLPLVFVFHGAYSNGARMKDYTDFEKYAEEKSFIVCYPDAAVENWEEGCECNKPYRLGIDDIGFIEYLIKKFSRDYNIDQNKVFAAGYSQGGLFAQNVACKLSNKFAAVASVAANMSVQLFKSCAPEKPISFLMIHGTNDFILPFNGSNNGSFSLTPTPDVFELWGKLNDCDGVLIKNELEDVDPNIKVIKNVYESCENNTKVILYKVDNGGHFWFSGPELNSTKTIVEFFLSDL